MKFAFVRPDWFPEWSGERQAIQDLIDGLKCFGHESFVTSLVTEAAAADHLFFIGAAGDQTPHLHFLELLKKDYGCIPFYEDKLLHTGASFGFFYYILGILEGKTEQGHLFSLHELIERPHLIFYFDLMRNYDPLKNYEFLKKARLVIAESKTEEKTLLRDVPTCQVKVVHWTSGHVSDLEEMPDDSFLKWTNLKSGEYILQIGRLELRKNQLGTLLAAKDLGIPLVFIAMRECNPKYEQTFLLAASKWSQSPIILITQHLPSQTIGNLRILQTKDAKVLPKKVLLSALLHAGLHLHPSFYELPGYTYLESARLGTPTIASSWSSLQDYLVDASGHYALDDRIEYVLPYDLKAIQNLIQKKFAHRYPTSQLPPIFQRQPKDVAQKFLQCV